MESVYATIATSAVWMFLFRKMRSWGWFDRIVTRFPKLLKALWEGWTECAYCGGFWIALALRFVCGIKTLHFQLGTPTPIDWFVDALATGLLTLLIIRILDSLAVVAAMKHKE